MPGRWLIATVLAGALALPAVAHAGGWATVSLSSTPDGMAAGTPWVVELEVLQHGVTPLDGVQPTVILTKGDTTRTFQAKSTGEPGVYRASVVFPTGGQWRYAVDDGFSQRHGYPPVTIGAAAAASAAPPVDEGPQWLALGAIVLALLAAGRLLGAVRRRLAPTPRVT
jgi:YtkA-like protein